MDWFWILWIVLPLVGIAAIGLSIWQAKKRTEAWQAVAGELGVEFLGDRHDVLSRHGHMQLLRRGRTRQLRNAVAGDTGDVRITIGDFRYRTGSGKNNSTRVETVCVLQSAALDVPHCFLRPESTLFDAIGSMLGGQDIDFKEDIGFSGAFVLQGPNEAAIRELFDEDVRRWFAARKGRRFHFEAQGNTLVFHTGRRRKPAEAKDLMQEALEIMNLLAERSKKT